MRTGLFIAAALFSAYSSAVGQQTAPPQPKDVPARDQPFPISRINGPVKLDGLSDEPAWAGLKPLPMT